MLREATPVQVPCDFTLKISTHPPLELSGYEPHSIYTTDVSQVWDAQVPFVPLESCPIYLQPLDPTVFLRLFFARLCRALAHDFSILIARLPKNLREVGKGF